MTREDLRSWAVAHADPRDGFVLPQAAAVLALLAECDRLHALAMRLADRCGQQSEILTRLAERASTPTPAAAAAQPGGD